MKKILITGGLGYIGSHTVVEFIKKDLYDVIVVDNNSTSETWIKQQIETITVYGNPQHLPVTENSPTSIPESPYGMTKLMSEHILQDAVKSSSLKVVSLRYFNPVGAHESGLIGELPIGVPYYLVPFITQTAIGLRDKLVIHGNDYPTRDGTCIRDYIYITDLALAHLQALEFIEMSNHDTHWHIFNLGTGVGVTVLEAVQAFIKATKQPLKFEYGPRRPGDTIEIYANFDKAKKILGWMPKTSLESMMLSAWNWEKYVRSRS
ncbi:hypothetical protein CHS0354_024025 [Potamilus streckersoni]|uniref:UDP-glucose 4-epimerase n=1 Tax=Potamilus streckersoni TaxID=2493646 RepID=A0AAE0VLA4_9BIVA|nr:hypothetical protein CHS0354_024025 [Potamilus streckersoni]